MANAQSSTIPEAVQTALSRYNADNKTDWTWDTAWVQGQNWSNQQTEFDTFINDYLFPKIASTNLAQQNLGNRFDFLAKEEPNMTAVMREDYVISDSVPTGLNLSKPAENMLRHNYPKMMTKLYQGAQFLKEKFTLNDNDAIINFQTIGDAINYAIAVYKKRISDINMFEEQMIKSMIVDYALNNIQDKREATSEQTLVDKLGEAILNLQNNSARHNEANKASGGAYARYSTYTPLKDMFILTSDSLKAFLLNSVLANTFQAAGIDITDRIVSFDDLGGTYKATDDIKLTDPDSLTYLRGMGAYEAEIGDVFYKGTTFAYDVSHLSEFQGHVQEIKPQGNLFAVLMDVNSIGYKRKTAGMLKKPFYNGERDEWTYWLHYQAQRYMRPFFNKVLISGDSNI